MPENNTQNVTSMDRLWIHEAWLYNVNDSTVDYSTNYKHFCTVFMFMHLYHAFLYYHDSVLQTVEFMK